MKRILFCLFCVVSFSFIANNLPVYSAEPVEVSATPSTLPLIFSELYANGQNLNPSDPSDESGSEFVEVYNRSEQTVSLAEFELTRSGSSTPFLLSGSLEPGAYLAVHPSFSIVNSGGAVTLSHKPTTASASITYTSAVGANEEYAYHLTDMASGIWQKIAPSPNQAPPVTEPEEPPAEEPPVNEPEEPPVPAPCSLNNVHLSEIVANPAGSDTLGGEFIEFYNGNATAVSLEGCTLLTDKPSSHVFAANDIIPAQSYRTINFADKLLNGGGTVTFQTAAYEEVVQYAALGDDEAWASISNTWQLTSLATPNAVNQPSPGKGAGDQEVEVVTEPCSAGKYRNPETGRCKNIEASIATITPCGPGKERNPETNRCRNIVTASSTLTTCEPGQERNPETNRCRKVAATTSELTPCKEGYERSAETNRCRKATSLPANTARLDDSKAKNPTHDFWVLGAAGAAIGGFLLYEYRTPIGSRLRKLTAKK